MSHFEQHSRTPCSVEILTAIKFVFYLTLNYHLIISALDSGGLDIFSRYGGLFETEVRLPAQVPGLIK